MTQKQLENFWSKVQKTDGCWIWTGCKCSDGYGSFGLGRKMVSAHRVSWIIRNGEIPKSEGHHGTCVLHRCDNPACVNPDHLFLGTQLENIDDRDRKGRGVQLKGEKHGMSRFTESQVKLIRNLYLRGHVTLKEIGTRFGTNKSTIGKIVNRKSWKHI